MPVSVLRTEMIHVIFRRVKPGMERQLMVWLKDLGSRAGEVTEKLQEQGVRHEQAFIVNDSEGPVLVWAMEFDDVEASREAFQLSKLPINLEHYERMHEVIDSRMEVDLLYEGRLDDGSGGKPW